MEKFMQLKFSRSVATRSYAMNETCDAASSEPWLVDCTLPPFAFAARFGKHMNLSLLSFDFGRHVYIIKQPRDAGHCVMRARKSPQGMRPLESGSLPILQNT